jgi:hypothetical protein
LSDVFWPTFLAVVMAFAIAYWELVTSKYPRTVFLARRCPYLYIYSAIYAVVAAVLMVAYEAIVPHSGPHSFLGGNLWIRAVAAGLFTKSFMHFKLFTVPGHPEPTPIGLETITLMFVPFLLKEIELGHDRPEMHFVKCRVGGCSLEQVIAAIDDHLPENMLRRDRQGFIASLHKAKNPVRAARLYLRLVGRGHFEMVFPLQ